MDNVFRPFDEDAEYEHRRRNLPHRQQAGCTYYVTFRTADALPQTKLEAIGLEKGNWFRTHPEPWSALDWTEYHRRFTRKLETWLGAGCGKCLLSQARCQEIVASAMRYFDGQRYWLDEFVVMPNHVHALLMPRNAILLEDIFHSWKSFTVNNLNKVTGNSGTFRMDENFDHAVRNWAKLDEYRRYIRNNPVRAGLKEGTFFLGKGKVGVVAS